MTPQLPWLWIGVIASGPKRARTSVSPSSSV